MRFGLRRLSLDAVRAVLGASRAHTELLEQAADAIFLASPGGRFVEVNQRACALLGYSRAELLGRSISDVLTPEAAADRRERMAALRNGETLLSERELVHRDGSRVPVEVSTRLLADGRLQGIARDISSRRAAYAAIRHSEERLRLALESGRIGIWEHDFTTGQTVWSALARETLGVSPEAPANMQTLETRVHPEDKDTLSNAFAASRSTHGEFRCEFRVVMDDGGIRHLATMGRISMDRTGEPQRIVGTVRDITKRKLAQAALQASEARLRAIVAAAPECVKLLDRDGRLLDMNPAGLAMIEVESLADVLGVQASTVVVPEHRAKFEALTAAAFRGESAEDEFDVVGLRGRLRSLESSVVPLRDESGAIVAALAISRDVTDRKRTEAALHASEQRMRSVLEQTPIILFATDHNGVFTLSRGKGLAALGVQPDQFNGHSVVEVFGDVPAIVDGMQRALAGESVTDTATVASRVFDCTFTPMFDGTMVVGVTGIATDVTERLAAEEERGRLAAIVESSQDAIIGRTLDGTITSWNHGAELLYGFTAEQAIGQHIQVLVPADKRSGSDPVMTRIARGEYVEAREVERVRQDGKLVQVSVTVWPIFNRAGTVIGAASIARDISERKQAEAALARQARHDALTGLPNRMLLQEQLDVAIERLTASRTPLALLLLDLDRFKEVNDALGHGVGDAVLQIVSERLQGAVRTHDTIARLGGDEFAVLLGDADESRALQVAQRVRAALAEAIEVSGVSLDVGASIGVALAPGHGQDPATLLRRADLAMYAAKRAGEGISLFTPDLDRDNAERLGLTGELRAAIERDQLVLHYQPKITLADGRVVGVEALVRWQHPTRGLLRPDQFIPVAEQAGLIEPLTYWVLRTACAQQAAWQAAGLELSMAVNLSVQSLRDANLLETVRDVLAAHPDCRGGFELELTESMLMSDPARARTLLASLRGMGVRVAVDDFGTGYSSLAYLKRLPLDEIKIDRSFLRDVATDPRDAALVRATIELGHTLGLRVVAEGVEDAESLALLEGMGCDEVQGYYISRPVEPTALANWASTWQLDLAAELPRAA